MQLTFHENFDIDLYGFSAVAANQDWPGTGMALMNKLWPIVKSQNLKNKGINVWVYEPGDWMFAGVELESPPPPESGLERKTIHLAKYAHVKHVGPYRKIAETFPRAMEEIKKLGIREYLPYLEIYGHWTEDESKLETDLLWNID
jgi:hypothetical protein